MRIPALAVLAALFLPLPMLADTYVYTYTGNDFNTYGANGLPQIFTGDNVTAEFALSAPLASNLTDLTIILPTYWSVSAGSETLTSADSAYSTYGWGVLLATNAAGTITGWDVFAHTSTDSVYISTDYLVGVPGFGSNPTQDYGGSQGSDDTFAYGSIQSSPGTWAVTDVPSPAAAPEPASLMLVASGLIGGAAFMRRRLRVT